MASVGTGYVQIVPSLRGFHQQVRRELAGQRISETVEMTPELDTKQVRAEAAEAARDMSREVRFTAEADTSTARREFGALARARDTVVTAQANVAGAAARLAGLSRPRQAGVTAEAHTAGAASQLAALGRPRNAVVDAVARVGSAAAQLAGLARPRQASVTANADTAGAAARLAVLARTRLTNITARAQTQAASAMLAFAARARQAAITVQANVAAAAARIGWLARPRRTTISVDADVGLATAKIAALTAAMGGMNTASRGAGRGMMIFTAVLLLAAPAVAVLGTALLGIPGLLMALLAPIAAVVLGFEGIKQAAQVMVPALDALKARLSATFAAGLTPVFQRLADVLLPGIAAGLDHIARGLISNAAAITNMVTSARGMSLLQATLTNIGTVLARLNPFLTGITDGFLQLAAVGSAALIRFTAILNQWGADFQATMQRLADTGILARAFDNLGLVVGAVLTLFLRLMEVGARMMAGPLGGAIAAAFAGIGDALVRIMPFLEALGRIFFQLILAILPPLVDLLNFVTPAFMWLAETLERMSPAWRYLVGVLTLVAVGLLVLGPILTMFTVLLKGVGIAVQIVSVAFKVIAAIFGLFTIKVWLIIAAVTALVVAIWWIATNWSTVWGWITQVFQAFVTWFMANWHWLIGLLFGTWGAMVGFIGFAWQNLWGWVTAAWNVFAAFMIAAWNGFIGFLSMLWTGFTNVIGWAWQNLWNWVTIAWNVFAGWIGGAWAAVTGFLTMLWTGFTNAIGWAWQGLWNWVTVAWNAFAGWIGGAWAVVTGFLTMLWTGFTNAIGWAWQGLWGWVTAAWHGFASWIGAAWMAVTGFLSTIWTGFTNLVGWAWQGLWNWISAVWNGFAAWISSVWGGLTAFLSSIWVGFTNFLGFVWQGAWNWISAVWNGFASWIGGAWAAVTGFLSAVWGGFTAFIGAVWAGLWAGITAVWNGFAAWISAAWTAVTGFLSGVWSGFTAFIGSVWAGLLAGLSAVWNGFAAFLSAAWAGLTSFLSGLWAGFTAFIGSLWAGLLAGLSAVWNGFAAFLSAAWSGLTGFLSAMWAGFTAFIGSLWAGLLAGLSAAWNAFAGFLSAAWNGLVGFLSALWGGFTNFIGSLWAGLLAGLSAAWNAFASFLVGSWNAVTGALSAVWAGFTGFVGSLWNGLLTGIQAVWNTVLRPTFDAIKAAVRSVGDAFAAAVDWIGRVWSRITGILARPVNFVIEFVYNRGIVGTWNKIAGWLDIPGLAPMDRIPENKRGGVLPGYTPGRDTGLSWVSGGEAIMRPEWVRAVGSGYIDQANRTARSRGVSGVQALLTGTEETGRAVPRSRRKRMPELKDYGGYMLPAFQGGGHTWPALWNIAQEMFSGAIKTSDFRPGDSGYHGRGMAVDFVTPNMAADSRALAGRYPMSNEIIHTAGAMIKNGQPHNYSSAVRANHYDHIHWANQGNPGEGGGGGLFGFNPLEMVIDWFKEQMKPVADRGGELTDTFGQAAPMAGMAKIPGMAIDEGVEWLKRQAGEAIQAIFDNIIGWLVEKFGGMFGGGGGGAGVQQWRGLGMTALRMTGQNPAMVDLLLMQMQSESGGDPGSINLWDSNAQKGTPSIGLMQVIGPTFDAYKMPGFGNISAPLDNILASIRYTLSRYGSLAAGWRGTGYDTGGVLPPGYNLTYNGTRRPEAVLTEDQWQTMRAAAENQGGAQVTVNYASPEPDPQRVAAAIDRRLSRTGRL